MMPTNPLPTPTNVPPFADPGNVTSPPLTSREKVATWFAGIILTVIIGISLALFWTWYLPAPSVTGASAADQATITQYKALSDIVSDRAVKLFDLVITKALLPLFATLIGFILGKQSST
jgi:hypothetical protein